MDVCLWLLGAKYEPHLLLNLNTPNGAAIEMKRYWVHISPNGRELKSSMFMVSAGMFAPSAANIFVGRLQAEGIRAEMTLSENHVLNHLYGASQDSIEIMVPSIQLERAQEIMAAIQNGDFQLTDEADVGYLEPD